MAVKEKKRVQVQIDKELADNTEAVLSQLGLNPTTAINMFYKRIVANGALPFNVSLSEEEREAYRDYADKMYNVRDTFSDDDY